MRIVWLAEKPSLRAASCCSVEVVNGGGGLRVSGLVSTASTEKCPVFTSASAARASASLVIERRSILSPRQRSEEHTSELQSLMRISYAVFCLKKKTQK